jgi:hypothetical protein
MIVIVRTIGAILALCFPLLASAQVGNAPSIVDFIAGQTGLTSVIPLPAVSCAGSPAGVGACQLAALFIYAVQQSRLIIGAVAFLIITIAGFRLIISQSEEALTTARRTVLGTVVGLFLFFVSEPFVDAIYGGFTIAPASVLGSPGNPQQGAIVLSRELLGIMRWGETLVAITAVALMIVQAVTVLGSFGAEETIRKAYRAILYTIMGLLLIVFDRVIAAIFGFTTLGSRPDAPSASLLIVEIFGFVRFFLFFVAMIVVGVVIYAGLLMLFHYGNDEVINRSKSTLINAALGLALIIVSFLIVNTVILGIT